MSQNTRQAAGRKSWGFWVVLIAAVLALAAGIYFLAIHTHNGDCFDPIIPWLLIGGGLIAAGLAMLKRYGLAAAVTAIVPGVALCFFIHECYWYVVDVFVGIDEKHGFDPRFIIFAALILTAFVVGEVAIYARKTREA